MQYPARAYDVCQQLTEGMQILRTQLSEADRREINRILQACYAMPGESQLLFLFADGHVETEEVQHAPCEDMAYMESFSQKIAKGRIARLMAGGKGSIVFANNQMGERMYSVLTLRGRTWTPANKLDGYRAVDRCGISEPGAYHMFSSIEAMAQEEAS